MNLMLGPLLDERFRFRAHRERPPLPHFDLVLAHEGGRLGPGAVRVKETCTLEDLAKVTRPPQNANQAAVCGTPAALAGTMNEGARSVLPFHVRLTG